MTIALDIQHCQKIYKNGVQAVKDVSLQVNSGDFFALLGPNGAGKTTLIGMIASVVKPTSGQIRVFGKDIYEDAWRVRQELGIMPQEVNFNIFHNSTQILLTNAGLYGITPDEAMPHIEHLLHALNLWDKRLQPVRNLSGGYKRRLMLARALVHKPKLLLLDEPTAGVDVEIRNQTWEYVKKINEQGTTIILTTHYLEEAENLCNKVAIVENGTILKNAQMADLLSTLEMETFILYVDKACETISPLPGAEYKQTTPTTLEVTINHKTSMSSVIKQLAEDGITVSSIKNKRNRLEELFMHITNQTASLGDL